MAQGEHDGRPLLARINEAAKGYAWNADMPFRLGVAVVFREPDARGFPGKEELDDLESIEDQLVAAVETTGAGRVVLVLTTGGMREFVSYVRTASAGASAAQLVKDATTSHDITDYVSEDQKWQLFRQFV